MSKEAICHLNNILYIMQRVSQAPIVNIFHTLPFYDRMGAAYPYVNIGSHFTQLCQKEQQL
jgi:hypothetical protein